MRPFPPCPQTTMSGVTRLVRGWAGCDPCPRAQGSLSCPRTQHGRSRGRSRSHWSPSWRRRWPTPLKPRCATSPVGLAQGSRVAPQPCMRLLHRTVASHGASHKAAVSHWSLGQGHCIARQPCTRLPHNIARGQCVPQRLHMGAARGTAALHWEGAYCTGREHVA